MMFCIKNMPYLLNTSLLTSLELYKSTINVIGDFSPKKCPIMLGIILLYRIYEYSFTKFHHLSHYDNQ